MKKFEKLIKLNKLLRIIALSLGVAVFIATPVFAAGTRQMFEGNASMTVNDFMRLANGEDAKEVFGSSKIKKENEGNAEEKADDNTGTDTSGNSSDTTVKYGITGEVVIQKKTEDPVPKPLDAEQSSSSGSVAKNQTVTTVFINNKPASSTSDTVRTDPEDVMTKQQEEEVLDTASIQNYINADYNVLQQFTNESEYTTRARQSLISFAMQFVGNPYVWGGTSLTNGCDCSGFVQEVFRHFGIITGRTSRDQYANCVYLKGQEVMPGDLIFYADETGYINHVAIYAGNYMIVHAANRKAGIKVNRYDYKRPYAYGRFIAN
ncbi:NlpC/P60 family protein [Oribacterium sp. KHPX15]|uniref:C40 family peptidase n=1 Tax=unclassified Oribacterium TaxID=2629782 RepID=UPI0004E23146|nr:MULTISPECIES: C40 family peptidase [unclassified Oribacterium]SEA40658.1 NlpC/P60 family protein [Oribacterium sp. KHPX15]